MHVETLASRVMYDHTVGYTLVSWARPARLGNMYNIYAFCVTHNFNLCQQANDIPVR